MKVTPPEDDASARARQFTKDVGAELSDWPPQHVAALLEGLADHLLEPGEHSEHLIDEVPSPSLYAAELCASVADLASPSVAATRQPQFGPGRWIVVALVSVVAVTAVMLAMPALFVLGFRASNGLQSTPASTQTAAATDPDAFTLPGVVGLEVDAAVQRLTDLGLSVVALETSTVTGAVPSGVVIEMQPAAPSLVTTDTEVLLITSP